MGQQRKEQQQLLKVLLIGVVCLVGVSAYQDELVETLTIRGQVIRQVERGTKMSLSEQLLDHQSTLVTLNSGQQSTFLTEDDHFILKGITPGKHIIEVTSKQFQYEKIVVIFYPKSSNQDSSLSIYSIDPNSYERIQDFSKPNRVVIKSVSPKVIKYFEDVESFNIMSLFSGQGIIIVVMILMYFCFKNVDMEKLQQQAMEQNQQQAPPQYDEQREQIRSNRDQ